jgi:p-aminobenzoyl-glutamate transporter AbgT
MSSASVRNNSAERLPRPEGLLALWVSVVAPPLIFAIQMATNYALVRHACSDRRQVALYCVNGGALLLLIICALVAMATWRRNGTIWPDEGGGPVDRSRFLSAIGLLDCALFAVATVAQGIAVVYFDPCQL